MGILRDTTINGTLTVTDKIVAGGCSFGGNVIFNTQPTFKKGLGWYGWSPILTAEDDTVQNWIDIGTNVIYFSGDEGTLSHRPSFYGAILNLCTGGDVRQMWFCLPDGDVYHRGGNLQGWINDGKWTKFKMEE